METALLVMAVAGMAIAASWWPMWAGFSVYRYPGKHHQKILALRTRRRALVACTLALVGMWDQ